MSTILLVIAAALALPQPVPPETAHLALEYHLTPHGCIAGDLLREMKAVGTLMQRRETRLSNPAARERELADTEHRNVAVGGVDAGIRLPLSIALYRAHRLQEAKAQWRTLLRRTPQYGRVDHATQLALREAQPPDTAGLNGAQFDGIALLLQYD